MHDKMLEFDLSLLLYERLRCMISRTFCKRLSFLFFCTLLPLPRFLTTTGKAALTFVFFAFVTSASISAGSETADGNAVSTIAVLTNIRDSKVGKDYPGRLAVASFEASIMLLVSNHNLTAQPDSTAIAKATMSAAPLLRQHTTTINMRML